MKVGTAGKEMYVAICMSNYWCGCIAQEELSRNLIRRLR